MIEPSASTSAVNVTRLIDDGPLTRFQIVTIVCCALVSALDGIDTQSIGVAAPFIADELGVKLANFGPIFSSTLVGATVGAASFGPLADRFGRKTLLIVAVLLIGGFTILTVFANSVPVLMAIRVLAGLGLGGATPCFIALTSEYSPARLRAALVTLMWSAFPLGGLLGGLLNWYLIPHAGWRAIFYIGGVAPLVLAVVLFMYLPESIKFLLVQRNDMKGVGRIVARFRSSLVRGDAHFVLDEKPLPGASIRHLFTEGRALGTLLLWVPFFMGFGVLTVAVLWTPALLKLNGISPANTAFVVAFNGLGGFIGQSTSGRLIQRSGLCPYSFRLFCWERRRRWAWATVHRRLHSLRPSSVWSVCSWASAPAERSRSPRPSIRHRSDPPAPVGGWPWDVLAKSSVRSSPEHCSAPVGQPVQS